MTQNAKTTFWKEIERDWNCGKSIGQSFEVRGEFVLSLIFGPRLVVGVVFNGLWARGLRHGAKDVGQGLALFGFLGQCALAHSFHERTSPQSVGRIRVVFQPKQ